MNKIIENRRITGTFGAFKTAPSGTFCLEIDGMETGKVFKSRHEAEAMLAKCERQAIIEGYQSVREWYETHI